MYSDNFVKVLYQHDLIISGSKINIYECSLPPTDEYGNSDMDALFRQTFVTENSNKDVFYEAYLSGTNKAFFTSKTPPTNQELLFQLQKFQQTNPTKLVIWVALGLFILFIFIM